MVTVKTAKKSPYILENLKPGTSYIVSRKQNWFTKIISKPKWDSINALVRPKKYDFINFQAYVEAENKYGIGQMSSIAVFRTSQKSIRRKKNRYTPTGDNFFKQKECCSTSGVKSECKYYL